MVSSKFCLSFFAGGNQCQRRAHKELLSQKWVTASCILPVYVFKFSVYPIAYPDVEQNAGDMRAALLLTRHASHTVCEENGTIVLGCYPKRDKWIIHSL